MLLLCLAQRECIACCTCVNPFSRWVHFVSFTHSVEARKHCTVYVDPKFTLVSFLDVKRELLLKYWGCGVHLVFSGYLGATASTVVCVVVQITNSPYRNNDALNPNMVW